MKFYFALIYNEKTYGIWFDEDKNKMKVSFKIEKCRFRFKVNRSTLEFAKQSTMFRRLKNCLMQNNLFFENEIVEKEIFEVLQMIVMFMIGQEGVVRHRGYGNILLWWSELKISVVKI